MGFATRESCQLPGQFRLAAMMGPKHRNDIRKSSSALQFATAITHRAGKTLGQN